MDDALSTFVNEMNEEYDDLVNVDPNLTPRRFAKLYKRMYPLIDAAYFEAWLNMRLNWEEEMMRNESIRQSREIEGLMKDIQSAVPHESMKRSREEVRNESIRQSREIEELMKDIQLAVPYVPMTRFNEEK